MKTITINQASMDLPSLINYSLVTHNEVNIATDNGSVIILPQEDYETMQETLRLLSDKKSLEALLKSHNNRDEGIPQNSFSIEEVFSDVQVNILKNANDDLDWFRKNDKNSYQII